MTPVEALGALRAAGCRVYVGKRGMAVCVPRPTDDLLAQAFVDNRAGINEILTEEEASMLRGDGLIEAAKEVFAPICKQEPKKPKGRRYPPTKQEKQAAWDAQAPLWDK